MSGIPKTDPRRPLSYDHRMTINGQKISSRHCMMLEMVAADVGYKEIAFRVGLAEGTVKQYLHYLFVRLGVTSKAAAVRLYIEQRMIETLSSGMPKRWPPIGLRRTMPT